MNTIDLSGLAFILATNKDKIPADSPQVVTESGSVTTITLTDVLTGNVYVRTITTVGSTTTITGFVKQ